MSIGAYCSSGAHAKCPKGTRCDCECHDAKGARAVPSLDDEMVWEDPPPVRHRRGLVESVEPFVECLRARPGKWCRLITYAGRTSASSQAGKLRKAFPTVEFRAGPHGSGSAIWARHVGAAVRQMREAR